MITYKVVGPEHDVCGFDYPADFPAVMKNFWKSRQLENAHGAVLAYDGKKLIGWFRWNYGSRAEIYAYGTYVLSEYRSQGVAIKLWRRALRATSAEYVHVFTTSYGGRKLCSALEKKFPKIRWYISRSY